MKDSFTPLKEECSDGPAAGRGDWFRNEDVRPVKQTAPVQLKMREQRLRWFAEVTAVDAIDRMKTQDYAREKKEKKLGCSTKCS
ncbi:unnamed protein product [Haemonchus placei]|uniref:Uncharacterized protein n=1 Tax=Haemonchus placei TaxID=6290 RepID=A0A0N4WGG4_HAEPC|nr:unnamed protein product [Haemonchus placei]